MEGTCLSGKRNGGYRSHATKRTDLGENANSLLKMGAVNIVSYFIKLQTNYFDAK
jgi:hypothetical protein